MHHFQIEFVPQRPVTKAALSEMVLNFASSLRMNGQICGREWPLHYRGTDCILTVLCPERNSLSKKFAGKYVNESLAKFRGAGVKVRPKPIAKEFSGAVVCRCKNSSAFILYTYFVSLEPSVRCLDCFGTKPLYRLAPMPDGEFYKLICWESDYQSCDRLQMGCSTLEAAGTRELSEVSSSLSKRGIGLCKELTALNGKPFYYYLYRASRRSVKIELSRCCPSCNRSWLNKEQLHGRFDFKCARCKLLSNWAWGLHKPA